MQKNKTSKSYNLHSIGQQGMAALLVTTVLITVIGLIVIGFSLTVRRNQKETLDRQLSMQAFYAAESGVNAVRSQAAGRIVLGQPVDEQLNCGNDTAVYTKPDLTDGGTASGIGVTCLEVSNKSKILRYDSVGYDKDTVVPVIATDTTANITKIQLKWKPTTGTVNPGVCQSISGFPKATNWSSCGIGLIRADIVNNIMGGDTPARTVFFKPGTNAAPITVSPSSATTGSVVKANCSVSENNCVANIDTLSGLGGGSTFYLRIRSLYVKQTALEVAAFEGATQINLSGQITIDSTGKAQDVLRRISVRVSVLPGSPNASLGSIESSGNICKRFIVAPGYYNDGGTSSYCKD